MTVERTCPQCGPHPAHSAACHTKTHHTFDGPRCVCCELCSDDVEPLTRYQSFIGKTWQGHKDCTEAEATKWVLVERADLIAVLDDPDSSARFRLNEAMEG